MFKAEIIILLLTVIFLAEIFISGFRKGKKLKEFINASYLSIVYFIAFGIFLIMDIIQYISKK